MAIAAAFIGRAAFNAFTATSRGAVAGAFRSGGFARAVSAGFGKQSRLNVLDRQIEKLSTKIENKMAARASLARTSRRIVNYRFIKFQSNGQGENRFVNRYAKNVNRRARGIYQSVKDFCPVDTGRMRKSVRLPKGVKVGYKPANVTVYGNAVSNSELRIGPHTYYAVYVSRHHSDFIYDYDRHVHFELPKSVSTTIAGQAIYLQTVDIPKVGIRIARIMRAHVRGTARASMEWFYEEGQVHDDDPPYVGIIFRNQFGWTVRVNPLYPTRKVGVQFIL